MAVGVCVRCHKDIIRAANLTEYKGRTYHSTCFTCTACGKNITGPQGFINHQEALYCHECYERNVAEKCHKCGKSLLDGGIRFKEKPYHKDCFTCGGCGMALGEGKFTVNNNQPYCTNCHNQHFAERCALETCNKPIEAGSQYVEVDNHKYHKDCFKCTNCGKSIADQPFVKDSDGNFCAQCADS